MWQDDRKRKSGSEVAVTLLFGGDSQQHELKATWTNGINADTYSHHSRYLAVFDGVSGVQPPWRPADMSAALAIQFESEMAKRFDQNAQVYDEAVRQRLSLSKKRKQESGSRICLQMLCSTCRPVGQQPLPRVC